MEIINVGIFLKDKCFAENLSRGLSAECRKMTFHLLNSPEVSGEYELILSDAMSCDNRVIFLAKSRSEENFTGDPPFSVYRYKESDSLIQNLFFIYFRLTGKVISHRGNRRTKVLAFTSVTGGCGTTSLSVATGLMLKKLYGCRSIYVNLCPLNDGRKYLHGADGENLLKMLYYLREKREFPVEALITETEDCDYIGTGLFNSYFDRLESALLPDFLGKIEELSKYDFLILDMGNHFCANNKAVLRETDAVILISRADMRLPELYVREFSEKIAGLAEESKMIQVRNYCCGTEEFPSDILCISRAEDAFSLREDGTFEISLTGSYGMDVAVLAKIIMEEGEYGLQ